MKTNQYSGFHKLTAAQRAAEVMEFASLSQGDAALLTQPEALKLEVCMDQRSSYGGPALAETTRQIGEVESFIAAHRA